MKKFLWIPVVFLLSSCGSTNKQLFVEPADGDRSRVRMVGGADTYVIPGKNCIDRRSPGAGSVSSAEFRDRSLGMPPGRIPISTAHMDEFYVDARKPITLVVAGPSQYMGYTEQQCSYPIGNCYSCDSDGSNCIWVDCNEPPTCYDVEVYRNCSTAVTFIPEKDVDYEAVYSEKSVSSCNVDVYPIGAHLDKIVKTSAPEKSCIIYGRDDTYFPPIPNVFETNEAKKNFSGDIRFYFADQPHSDVDVTLTQGFVVYKKARDRTGEKSIEKKDEKGCIRAALSILRVFQAYARKIGGNAVINIESYYRENTFRSNDQFECHAGNSGSHVILRGDIVKLK